MRKSMLLFFMLALSLELRSEAFANSTINIPKIGVAFFDNSLSLNTKPWGIAQQYTFGTSYTQAINYRWWWLMETSFAIGPLGLSNQGFLSAFMGGAGLRYNILTEEFRPHFGMTLHYVHLLGENTKYLPLNLGWPIFVGLKPYIALEWLVGSEMALLAEASSGFYVNINEPFKHIYYINLAWVVYL